MAYEIHLKQFDGPLDFLIHLIRQAQIDISEIFVSEITDQYLSAMENVDELDMDTASDFLDMAATLLYIKSRSLLPVVKAQEQETEETPEQQLIRRLKEYEQIKAATAAMETLYENASHVFSKLPDDIPQPVTELDFGSVGSEQLYDAFLSVMERVREKKGVPSEKVRSVIADRFTIRNCLSVVRDKLSKAGKEGLLFTDLFAKEAGKTEVIVTFMTLLEMIAHGEVNLKQSGPFRPITVLKKELLDAASGTDEIYMDEEQS